MMMMMMMMMMMIDSCTDLTPAEGRPMRAIYLFLQGKPFKGIKTMQTAPLSQTCSVSGLDSEEMVMVLLLHNYLLGFVDFLGFFFRISWKLHTLRSTSYYGIR